MEPKQMFKQMIDFIKSAFANSFDTMVMFQEHTETMGNMFMEKTPLVPEEGKKASARGDAGRRRDDSQRVP